MSTPRHQASTDDTPAVPAKVRTAAYFVGLGASALVSLAVGLVALYMPDEAVRVAAAGGVVLGVVGMVTGGLGVAYRPTRISTPNQPDDPDPGSPIDA